VAAEQLGLFGSEPIDFDRKFATLRRIELGEGAWLDYQPGFLRGHRDLYDSLQHTTRFQSDKRVMYENEVAVPRLHAQLPDDGPGHPIIFELQRALSDRYGEYFARLSLALYRDGLDSVAWHGDYVARRMEQALVASVSLGSPRKFLIRRTGGGPSRSLTLGWGDLLVMGGTCQRTHQHAVPKVASAAPRLVLMFRPVWKEDGVTNPTSADRRIPR
jgi:alkylated DNA repair dioxygenase AlkB